MLQDLDIQWRDARLGKDMLDVGRGFESESAIVGASAHLLGVGRKR
jgi:hypothetical protein